MTNGNDPISAMQNVKFSPTLDAVAVDAQGNYPLVNLPGLTKREYFAAMAMQGVVTAWSEVGTPWHESNDELLAERAVNCADALIAVLNAQETK